MQGVFGEGGSESASRQVCRLVLSHDEQSLLGTLIKHILCGSKVSWGRGLG